MAIKKCERCDLNYITNDNDEFCDTCKAELNGTSGSSKNMNATMVNFVFRLGVSPELNKDEVYILVFDKDGRCVGYVFSHFEKSAPAHDQAEISFFQQYQSEYGQWHRIFIGNDGKMRYKYVDLKKHMDENGEYEYTAALTFVKKD